MTRFAIAVVGLKKYVLLSLIDPRHRRIAFGVECDRRIIDIIVLRFVLAPWPALPAARRDLDACSPLDRNLRFGGLMDRCDGIVISLRLRDRADRNEQEYDRRLVQPEAIARHKARDVD